MLRSGGRTVIARDIFEDDAELLIDIVALRKSLTLLEGYPGTFKY